MGDVNVGPATNMPVIVSNVQLDTANTKIANARIEMGWGQFATGAAANKTETVTFATAFNVAPTVLLSYGGDNTSGTATYGAGAVQNAGDVVTWAHTVTTSNFIARVQRTGGANWGASDTVFYQWIAIGN